MTSSNELQAKLTPGDSFFAIIKDAYRLFAVPTPASTDVCDCCMNPKIERDFFHPPIDKLPVDYVRDWYFAAYDPSGVSKQTWTYLLPRILEILAAGEEVSATGLEVSLSRFGTGNPANWSPDQWRILDQFQHAYLKRAVEDGTEPVDDVLCMFRLGGWPLAELLDQVAEMPTETLARRFWNDWCKDHVPGREGVWITAFWEGTDNSTVFEFYTSPDLHHRISELALAHDTGAELRAKALGVASVIETNATWIGN